MGVRKKDRKWYVDFSFNHTRYRRPSPDNSRAGALAYELVLRQRLARGESLEPEKKAEQPKELLFEEFAWDWFETYVKNNNKHSEILTKEMILKVHLVPYFGRMPLDAIGNLEVEKYKAQKRNQSLSAKTINNHLTVLRKSLRCAQEWGLVKNNPIIKMLKTAPPKYDFLSPEESRQLLEASDGMWHDLILLALETGLRLGELLALKWEDIDFEIGELTISRAYARGVLGTPKSNRIRHIPMSDSVRRMLVRLRKPTGLVFPDPEDQPLKNHVCLQRLQSLCKRSGLRKIGWHTLRHTFASHLVQAGANLLAVQGLLGHSDIHTTMRYAHLNRTALQEAMRVLTSGNGSSEIRHYSVTGATCPVEISEQRLKLEGEIPQK